MLSKKTKDNLAIAMADNTAALELSTAVDSGGLTVLATNSRLSGTYDASVLVQGPCELSGAVVVNGNLYCQGDISNPYGYSLTVLGDFIVNNHGVLFSTTSPTAAQGNFIVNGDFHFAYFEMLVNHGSNPQFKVYGDLVNTNNDDFIAHGRDGTPGLSVWIGGDCIISYMDLHGGDATVAYAAGAGGSISVQGDMITYDGLDVYGGNSSFDGKNGGNGGSIFVVGDFLGYVSAYGGNGNANCSAGSGGQLQCYGTYTNYWSVYYGGNCGSTASADSAGQGGQVQASQLLGDSYMSLSGGVRTGSLAENINTTSPPNAGYLYSAGNIYISHLDIFGGDVSATFSGVSNAEGGAGGNINCKGDVIVWYIGMNGGQSLGMSGGNGGQLTTKGRLDVEYQIIGNGGGSDIANGSAGLITAKAGFVADNVTLQDGNGLGTPSTNTCGIQTAGICSITNLDQVDRENSIIKSWYPGKIQFSCSNMVSKKTLNQPNGDATADISANLGDSIFSYDPITGWYKMTGTSVAAG